MRFIFCCMLAILMSEGYMYLCGSDLFNEIEKVLIFVTYVSGITKFTYMFMKKEVTK
jgi:hypothetical protein